MLRTTLIIALLVGLAGPAAAEPTPKPQTFVVVSRARLAPLEVAGPEARALLEGADAAIALASAPAAAAGAALTRQRAPATAKAGVERRSR